MRSSLQKAQCLAKVILAWHQQFGRTRVQEENPPLAVRYLNKLDHLSRLDLNRPEHLYEIAKEQIGGIFEHFYSMPIPPTLWEEIASQTFVHPEKPKNLGSAGRLILQLLHEEDRRQEAVAYELPAGWKDSAVPLRPGRVKLPLQGKPVSEILREYFAPIAKLEEIGIGGRELMVAMNEDVKENAATDEDYVPAYSPASFGFHLATGEGRLVTQVIKGEISILAVLLGWEGSTGEGEEKQDGH